MRSLALILGLVAGLVLAPGPSLADCNFNGQGAPCRTDNGEYRIRKPAKQGPHPTVVYLYGSLGNSARTLSHQGFVQAFVERGYAVIVPAALNLQYADGVGSGWYLRNERGRKKRNDTKFIAEVLNDAANVHGIDRDRVLIAGMSRGGFLTWEIACHNPGLAAAFAPVAAGYLGKMPDRCAQPVRLLHTHGRSDPIVPLDPSKRWNSGGARMKPLNQALDTIGRMGGCTEAAEPSKLREYDRIAWKGCTRDASVDLLLHNGDHTIPLSWYSTVMDWFEQGFPDAPGATVSGVGAPSQAGSGTRPRFKGVGDKGGRFKKARELPPQ